MTNVSHRALTSRCFVSHFATSILLAIAAGLFVPIASGANIVLNSGFETGDFTNWTVSSGDSGFSWFVLKDAYAINGPHTGTFFAETPCFGPGCITTPTSFFFQDLPTVDNQTYTLTFWYDLGACQDGCDPEELKVLWGGNTAFDLATTTSGTTDPGWVQATVSGLLATSTIMRLEFVGRHDPGALGIDDIGISSSIPEPSSMVLLGSGLVAIACRRWLALHKWRTLRNLLS